MIKLWQIIDMIRDERRRIEMAGFSGKHDLFDHRILVAMALGASHGVSPAGSAWPRRPGMLARHPPTGGRARPVPRWPSCAHPVDQGESEEEADAEPEGEPVEVVLAAVVVAAPLERPLLDPGGCL